jgi:VanZ family protein
VWGPVIAQLAAIFFASSLSNPGLPSGVSDKTGHFIGYGMLGAFILRALAGAAVAGVTAGRGLLSVGLASLYAASDEFHQSFVPGRSPDPADWVADTLGAIAAVLLVLGVAALLGRRRSVGPR